MDIHVVAFHPGDASSRPGGAHPAAMVLGFDGQRTAVVVAVKGPSGAIVPTLVDVAEYDSHDAGHSWYVQSNGYVYSRLQGQLAPLHVRLVQDVPPGRSIDHINRVKTDNRRANLRVVDQAAQNANRADRADRINPPDELVALGISRLPRYMRWDNSEAKFTCAGHPFASFGPLTGTKSAAVSLVDKFRDCLQKLVHAYDAHGAYTEQVNKDAKDRVRLASEYNELVRFAHTTDPGIFPDGPYVEIDDLEDEPSYCRKILGMLPAPVEGAILHGPRNGAVEWRAFPDEGVIAQIKASSSGVAVTMFDLRLASAVETLPLWDTTGASPCLPVTTGLARQHPSLVGHRKVQLADFVWHVLLGHPAPPPGFVVVPLNYQQYDLRAENLVLAEGATGKEYRRPKDVKPAEILRPAMDAHGMTFMPRGVTMSADRGSYRFQFGKGSPAYGTSPIAAGKTAASVARAFFERVLPKMRDADPEFEGKNAAYQRMSSTYAVIMQYIVG